MSTPKHKYHVIEYNGRFYYDNDWLSELYSISEELSFLTENPDTAANNIPAICEETKLLIKKWNALWRKVEAPNFGKPDHRQSYLAITVSDEETAY